MAGRFLLVAGAGRQAELRVLLGLGRAAVQAPETVDARGPGQGVAAFALVQLRRGLPAELGPLQPVQGVRGPPRQGSSAG